MKASLASFLALWIGLSGIPASAQSPTSEVYNVKATPLDDLSRELLLETGYVIREDGKIWDKIADSAVRLDEMSYLLSRLAGARRLKALLELNLILNRSEGEKKLTDAEREQVRALLRKHWAVFGVGTRKDFRGYFTNQELVEELDKIPPRFDRGSAMLMRDPDPNTAPALAATAATVSITATPPVANYAPVPVPAPAPATEAARPAAESPRQFVPRSVLTPFLEPLSLRRPSPFAPRARAPEAVVPSYAAPAAAQAPAPVAVPAPSAPQIPSAIAAVLGAMAPVDEPRQAAAPQTFAPAVAPSPAPAAVVAAPAPAPAQQPLPPMVFTAPPPLTPRNEPVTSAAPAAPPAVAAPATAPVAAAPKIPGMVFAAPTGRPAFVVPGAPLPAAAPSTSLFGSTPPPQPAGGEGLGTLKPWVPPGGAAAETPAASAAPAPAVPAPAAAAPPPIVVAQPGPPKPADASQAEYDAFVAAGPYGRESQALLRMIAEKAPEFCRAILRRTVVRGAPLVVIDGTRAGSDRRAGFAPSDPAHPGAVIALSAGPVLVERKSGMFSKTLIALPEDPRAWAELGLTPPALEALSKSAAPKSQDNGPWGALRIYGDRSRHGTYSPQEQAGELLERLLLLGLEREGFASSTYAARAWARAARLLFSARVAEDYGNDSFLDPDRKLELREWIERGDESDDLMVAAWSSSRGNVLDPRRGGPESQSLYERQAKESCTRSLLADHLAEAARNLAARVRTIEGLVDSGLIGADAAKASAEKAAREEAAARAALLASPPACDGRFGADESGLRRSAALLAEVSRAERAFRERKVRGTNHD